MQRLETLQTDNCSDFDHSSASDVFSVAMKTDEEAGSCTNDSVADKDKCFTAN